MEVIYGIRVREPNDRYYEMVERMREVAETIAIPGNFPVEAFPVLRYLPSWFPGAGFKKWAAEANRDIAHTVSHLFEGAKEAAVSPCKRVLLCLCWLTYGGSDQARDPSRRSMVNRMLNGSAPQGDQVLELETMCKEIAATLYVGTRSRPAL